MSNFELFPAKMSNMKSEFSVDKNITKQKLEAKNSHKKLPIFSLILVLSMLISAALLLLCVQSKSREIIAAEEQAQMATEAKHKIVLEKRLSELEKARAEAEARARAEAEAQARARAEQAAQVRAQQPHGVKCRPVADSASITVVVNKKYCFSPLNWAPNDLVDVGGGHYLRAVAAKAYHQMRQAAQKVGYDFTPSSAYRSYATQKATYAHWVRVNGSVAIADTVSARAGFSEHQTGLVADFKVGSCALECFDNQAVYKWLVQHAADYGFIQRYQIGKTAITGYEAESWHWRYVGVDVARDLKAKGVKTLEEYYGIEGGNYLK